MRTLLSTILLLAVLAGCAPGEPAADAAPEGEAAGAPQVTPVTAAQLQQEVANLDADAVVVNVWATWCGPCRAEFPEFVRYGRDMADQDVAVRFLSVDDPAVQPRVEEFLQEYGVTGRTYLSSEGTDIVATLAAPNRWTYGIPVTLIYGPDGRLMDFWEGAVNYDFLQAKVKRVLDQTATSAATTG